MNQYQLRRGKVVHLLCSGAMTAHCLGNENAVLLIILKKQL